MRILLDHCVDMRFKALLSTFEVSHTKEMGWESLSNGKLLAAAEKAGFDVFLTVDKGLRHQQNIAKLGISVVTLATLFTSFDDLSPLAPQLVSLLDMGVTPGSSYVLTI